MPGSRTRTLAAVAIIALAVGYVCLGLLRDPSSLGGHDWDAMESYRVFTLTSLQRFGQFPFWDPYACGGYPFWSAPESGTTIVSPLLPVYLLLPLATAIRIEIVFALLLALVGTWLLAGLFCRNPLLKAGVCLIAVLNSRWALQAAAGHAWHLYYALFPWVLFGFVRSDQASERARPLWLGFSAICLTLMIYVGAIYPFPHAVLALGGYAGLLAWSRKQWRPLLDAGTISLLGIGLAAPKFLPLLDTMSRFPRLVKSFEFIDPISYLLTFVVRAESRSIWPFWHFPYGYHENGIYIGVPAVLALVFGLWQRPQRVEARALRWVGLSFFWLSLGMLGPWLVLHLLPFFRSQHVPFRFAYPGLLLVSIAAAASLEERLGRPRVAGASQRATELLVVAAVALIATDIARESGACLALGFGVHPPRVALRSEYVQTLSVPKELTYAEANGPAALGTHQANVGSVECGSFHGFNTLAWKVFGGRVPGQGAHGLGEAAYRGEVYLASGQGSAKFAEWSPNRMVVDVHDAHAGDLVMLNQNFDPSWRANGAPALSEQSINAYRLRASDERVVFQFWPRTLPLGFALLFLSLTAMALSAARAWRRTAADSTQEAVTWLPDRARRYLRSRSWRRTG